MYYHLYYSAREIKFDLVYQPNLHWVIKKIQIHLKNPLHGNL